MTPALVKNESQKSISEPMPKRKAFSGAEQKAVLDVIDYYNKVDADPGYHGHFENLFCNSFSQYMGGGYTTAVATGTGSIYVALAALELPQESEVIISPITDPGSLNAIILQGYKVSLADSAPQSLNTCWEQIKKVITDNTSAIMVVHCGGVPTDIDIIVSNARKRGIKVIEDCSQSPGASYKGKMLGTYGDIAAVSTMYRKSLSTGGSGGLVFTNNDLLHKKVMSHADRGKELWSEDFQERNANQYLFPALNWSTDEISCSIGSASLARLPETIENRVDFALSMAKLINENLSICSVNDFPTTSSPFFLTINIDTKKLASSKSKFCSAIIAEGVDLNPHYQFVIAEWQWAFKYLTKNRLTPNAIFARDNSFNLYLNENYTLETAKNIFTALLKIEKRFLKN